MKKKAVSGLLAILLIVTMLPVMASAETYSGTCGENLTWELDSETGVLIISGEGDMEDYNNSSPAPWYNYRSMITSVIIKDGVTCIGSYAFQFCDKMKTVEIPESVTSIHYIAFQYCSSLTTVLLPSALTEIGQSAFNLCKNLTSIHLPATVESIGQGAFAQCDSLTSITVDALNSNYSSENGVLFNQDKTILLQYPSGKSELEYTIPSGVVEIAKSSFTRQQHLVSVKIPDSVTTIGEMAFSVCHKLTNVYLGKNVETIGWSAFNGCDAMTSIIFQKNVKEIAAYAFADCEKLQSVYFLGDAPTATAAFDAEVVVYYAEGTSGWSTPTWNDYACYPYTPVEEPGFHRDEDAWSFENAYSIFDADEDGYYITESDYARLVKNLPKTDRELLLQGNPVFNLIGIDHYEPFYSVDGETENAMSWTGSCYGMSSWAWLAGTNEVDISAIGGADTLSEYAFDKNVESAINFYMWQQNLMAKECLNYSFMEELGREEQLDLLEELAAEASQGGDPLLISYQWYDEFYDDGRCNTEKSNGHAVLGYGLEDGDYTDYVSDVMGERVSGYEFTSRVLIYDCSELEDIEGMHIYIGTNGTERCICIPGREIVSQMVGQRYDIPETRNNNGLLKCVTADVDYINMVDYESGEVSPAVEAVYETVSEDDISYLQVMSDDLYSLTNGDASATIQGFSVADSTFNSAILVSVSSNITADGTAGPSLATAFLPAAEQYTVESQGDDTFFRMQSGNCLMTAAAASPAAVTFETDGGVSLQAEEPTAYSLQMTVNDGWTDLPWSTVEISGTASDLSLSVEENAIVVAGSDLSDVLVTASKDGTTAIYDLTSSESCVLLTEQDMQLVETKEETVVKTASNGENGVTVTISNYTQEEISGCLFFAAYNADGKMIDVKMSGEYLGQRKNLAASCTFDVSVDQIDTVKVFLAEQGTMRPICCKEVE